jgi:AcrR family transcriptional regulator
MSRRRPRFTPDEIAAAALAMADADGIEALSMRRLADKLGVGTMTLYHYVPSKRELLALMEDAVTAELLATAGETPTDWRDGLEQLAHRMRAAWQRRPWAITALYEARIGPNGMRVFEQTLAAMANLPLEPDEKMEVISLVQDYVLGFVFSAYTTEVTEESLTDIAESMTSLLTTGAFPQIEQIVDGDVDAFVRRMDAGVTADDRFERGLGRVLDGVALAVEGPDHDSGWPVGEPARVELTDRRTAEQRQREP